MISTCVMLAAPEVTPSSGLWALQAQQERWLSSQAAFGHLWAPHVLSEEVVAGCFSAEQQPAGRGVLGLPGWDYWKVIKCDSGAAT